MDIIAPIFNAIHYGASVVSQNVNKIARDPSAAKKACQIISKTLEVAEKDRHFPEAMRSLKGAVHILDFYASFKDLSFWLQLFSKEGLDQQLFLGSLTDSCYPYQINDQIIDTIFHEVMGRSNYYSEEEVFEALKDSLERHCPNEPADEIAHEVIVTQKTASLLYKLAMVCFTIVNLGSNLKVLHSWNVLNLSVYALQMGSQSWLFLYFAKQGVDVPLGIMSCAGSLLLVIESTTKAVKAYYQRQQATTPEEKEKYDEECRLEFLTALPNGVDFITTALPLIRSVDPKTVIFLSLVSKGVGLACTLLR